MSIFVSHMHVLSGSLCIHTHVSVRNTSGSDVHIWVRRESVGPAIVLCAFGFAVKVSGLAVRVR